MNENKPSKYIKKIILEILNHSRCWFHQWQVHCIEKSNIARFNPRAVAYAFLRQYNGETFVKAQKITVRYNDQKICLCVRDLIYGKIDNNSNRISDSMVEFIYRIGMFTEIRWPATIVNQKNEVESKNDKKQLSTLNTIQSFQDEISTPMNLSNIHIDVDKTPNVSTSIVPCTSCNDRDDNQILSVTENVTSSLCQDCRIHRPVSSPQNLITGNDTNLPSNHVIDDENHCRSSIFIYINRIKS
ncbi:unnamed protein product [Rotaria sordida]|uniref:Uncharacterized protein n=1 Tax=Rotaria sordida TaxID=392033 RepID=A0A814D0U3_9BILA|nr:unnamed protein product [Rotaria sordida]CAF0949542.1 unnamed protein product [Rotaria sordida]